ncbi:MAG: hypothetical protein EF813_11740 [Methanosarcinales archaeon]|nr:MAG: hypothetical protein EF813_11740 [Methanosarcinales archaeon]
MSRYIPDIRAIRSFVPFVILYADFITNFTNMPNATNFNRLFSGKPYAKRLRQKLGGRDLILNDHAHVDTHIESLQIFLWFTP